MTITLRDLRELTAANWRLAVADWRAGDPSLLDHLLRGGDAIPDYVRVFLADVLAGKEARPKGRPKAPRYRPDTLRAALVKMDYEFFYRLCCAVPGKRGAGTPDKRACEAVAKKWRFKVTPGTVSHIVHKRRGG